MNTWLRDHPWQADGLLAAVLLAFSAPQLAAGTAGAGGRAGYIAVGVLLCAMVIPRRRYPTATFAVAAAVGAAQVAWGVQPGAAQPPVFALQPNNADLAILILLYTLAAYRPRPVSLTGLAVCLAGAAVAIARWSPAQHAHAGPAIFGAAAGLGGVTLTAWVLGDSVAYRYRRARFAALEERAARLEAERDAQARVAAAAERARELQDRRARAVDESAARLRRIERDLHDGAQARLVALGLNIGFAEQVVRDNPDLALTLLAEARQSSGQALSELRTLVRGIHPPALAERGLDGAVRALALSLPLPVDLHIELPGRPVAPVESAAYFAIAEVLANVVKHSGANRAWVQLEYDHGRLIAIVGDNGAGGAHPRAGGGLQGIERRLNAFDGTFAVTSPAGGPTQVTMELPCELSLART